MNRKRILFVAHDSWLYGPNQSLVNMVSSLENLEIDIFTVFPQTGPICDVFDQRGWRYFVINYRNELYPKINGLFDQGIHYLRYFYKQFLNWRALKSLSEIVMDNKIDIIHSNSAVVKIGFDLSQITNTKHIWHLREFIHPNYGLFVYGGLEKYKEKVRRTDHIICITEKVCNEFNLGKNALILKDAIRKTPRYSESTGKSNYFLFCGSLHKNKGIEEAIYAYREVIKSFKNYRLLIVGEGTKEYENYLKDLVKEEIAAKKIEFLGFRNDVDEIMSKALALLMCSRNEALGRVTIEAMLNFCLVFGYNEGGTAELIVSEDTGVLYDTTEQLIELMTKRITRSNDFATIINKAHQFASIHFLEANYGERLVKYYNTLD